MCSIPIINALPDTVAAAVLPIAIAGTVAENDLNMGTTCIGDYPQAPLLPTNNIEMAPDDPDKWPSYCLQRELIELKKTIDVLELWTWLQVEFPPEGDGFMFWDHENMDLISDKLEELYGNEHSGFTWGQSMRNIQFIAKNGFDNWKQEIDTANRERRERKEEVARLRVLLQEARQEAETVQEEEQQQQQDEKSKMRRERGENR
jgi:hypothetical protein